MILAAKEVPWSSVVGNGVMLLDKDGKCIGILSLHSVVTDGDRKETSVVIAKYVTRAINGFVP